MRLLSPELGLNREGIELVPAHVIAAADVTHIRYAVGGRRPLILDNRGQDEQPVTATTRLATAPDRPTRRVSQSPDAARRSGA
jgi:hypothetical protein